MNKTWWTGNQQVAVQYRTLQHEQLITISGLQVNISHIGTGTYGMMGQYSTGTYTFFMSLHTLGVPVRQVPYLLLEETSHQMIQFSFVVADTEMGEQSCCSGYPWHLLVRTLVLLLAFLAYGVNSNLFGPTLLDLKVITVGTGTVPTYIPLPVPVPTVLF